MRMWQQTVCRLFVLALAMASASAAFAQGTIRYVKPQIPISFGPVPGFDYQLLDLNGDNLPDFVIDTSLLITSNLRALGSNRVLTSYNWDGGLRLQPLSATDIVSPQPLLAHTYWNSYGALSACSTIGCLGPWLGMTAYAGVEFRIGEDVHYGWIRINNFANVNAGSVLDWAYETRPGVPILAGAVPEPSALALLVGGGVLMVWFRRKRNERMG
jgi:hypothetical protein